MAGTYDAIIIGGGHNGLVTACYLARQKWKVLVLERRYLVGGACVTEEVFPGYKVSTAAYVNSLFRPEIIRELRLKDYGFEVIERNPSSFSPFLNGKHLLLGADERENVREIAKFSTRDAEAYPKYERMLERVAHVVEPTIAQTPPNIVRPGLGDFWRLFTTGRSFQKLGTGISEAIEVLTGSARTLLDRWFESEELKATLATDAIIGAFAPPSFPGTAYVLFHHVMGETNGKRGVWAYMRGGMGGLSQSLARAAKDLGVEIRCDAEVARIILKDGAAAGVALTSGEEFLARKIGSSVDARLTFTRFLDPRALPPDFAEAIDRIDYSSASLKINLALSELPNFTVYPGTTVGPQHRGTVHLCPSQEYIEQAFDDAKYGRPSRYPVVECTIPSSVDSTIVPPGKHLMSMFVQYAPYKLKEGSWEDAAVRDQFVESCIDVVQQHAPNFRQSILHRHVLTPLDLEKVFNLSGGNIFQGSMSLNQLFMFRPVPGYASYRTPIRNLYLCGAAAHPGGGVMGAAGRNAAREMLRK